MKVIKKMSFFSKEMKDELMCTIDIYVRVYLAKHRKRFIAEYIKENFSKLSGEDRALTSKEVMDMLQISRATLTRRIKKGKLKPVNPNERVHRFLRSEVVEFIRTGKGVNYDR